MKSFYSPIRTVSPLSGSATLLCVSEETRDSTAYRAEGRGNPNPHHALFQYTISGYGMIRDATGDHPVPPGSGFLCENRDREVSYFYPKGAKEPWRFIFMDFAGGAAYRMVRDMVSQFGHIYKLPRDSTIIERMVAFHVYHNVGCFIQASEGMGLVFDMLRDLLAGKEAEKETGPEQTFVRRAQHEIQSAVADRITVGEIASRLRISREHLTRVFTEQVGLSPYQYILGCKMLTACGLLKSRSLEVKEVAAALGYDTTSHFSRVFQRVMDMTPSNFRKHGSVPTVLSRQDGKVRPC